MNVADVVSTIISLAITLGALAMAVAYVWAQVKSGTQKEQKDANDNLKKANEQLTNTLNELLKTQDKKIDELKGEVAELRHRNANLEGRVEELSKKNGDLQEIINKALDRYFELHPDEAVRLTTIKSIRKTDTAAHDI